MAHWPRARCVWVVAARGLHRRPCLYALLRPEHDGPSRSRQRRYWCRLARRGIWRIRDAWLTARGRRIRVGIIQPNIEQAREVSAAAEGDKGKRGACFTTNLAMTRDAVRRGAEFVIWPESAIPFHALIATRARTSRCATGPGSEVPILLWQRSMRTRWRLEALQRRLSDGSTGRPDGGGVSQDSPGAVRRVRADGRLVALHSATGADVAGFEPFSPGIRDRASRWHAPDQHRYLSRGRMSTRR